MTGIQRQDLGYSRTVSYSNSNHLSLILQRWGSINRKVLPFCLANTLLAVMLVRLQEKGIDLSISEFGHEFMSVLVSFLVINKLSYTLNLYYECLGYLSKMNQSSIELTQLTCAFTDGYQQDEYKEWRLNVTIQILTLLRATVFMVYKGGEENIWEISELKDHPLELFVSDDIRVRGTSNPRLKLPKELYVWGYHLKSDKNLRVPIRLAQRLRNTIMEHKMLPTDPLDTIQERTLMDLVKEFMNGYYGVRNYLTCPMPLPLVQLGRVFVIFFVFTLPFALLSPTLNLAYGQMILLTFLMTYGYMGMELLFVEIYDPFAEEPNDLPLTEEARAAGEDIFLSLMQTDGRDAADRLKKHFTVGEFPMSVEDIYYEQVKAHGPVFDCFCNRGAKETDPLV